jgi:hypothetical protein
MYISLTIIEAGLAMYISLTIIEAGLGMYISLIQRSYIIFIYYPMIIYVQFEFKQVCRFLGRKYFSL